MQIRRTADGRRLVAAGLLAAAFAVAAESASAADAGKGQWIPISEGVTAKVKCGYPGLTAGVAVDRASGDVFMVVCDQGIWKSSDKGATFERADGGAIGGRCETGFALNADPAGGRMMCFMIYGGSAYTADGGKTWKKSQTSHLDVGAVDWEATGQCLLSVRHESGGMLCMSTDAGASWKDLEKGFSKVGLFDARTLVACKGKGLVRSTDGGATWTAVSDVTPPGFVMTVFKGTGYWATEKGLLASRDKGATWAVQGAPVNAFYGPYFGKDEKHLVVVGKDGFHETRDGGLTWAAAAPLPAGMGVGFTGPNYAWDPKANVFYASSMGKPTCRYAR
jgi:hypothetical protein